jgi:hypothetical protein
MSTYDLSAVRAECEAKGLQWSDEFEQAACAVFQSEGLSQPAVERTARLHLDYVCWLFSPQTYDFRQRLGLAWHFLFGKGFR